MSESRPDPDELLIQLRDQKERAARGRLRIYFGSAAGVGKTYAMLAAGRALKASGVDVVAGVIGTHKFVYDIWGDTVNIASRMESHGTSGVIQITRNTFDLVSEHFDCQARGPIEVKGVGRVETWYVTGRTPTHRR